MQSKLYSIWNILKPNNLQQLLTKRLVQTPVLVWIEKKDVDLYSFPNKALNQEIYRFLNALEKKHDGQFPLLIATEMEFMRAVDYRAPKHGITLVIGKSFDNQRDA